MARSTRWKVVALVLSVALVAVACGDDDGGSAAQGSPAESSEASDGSAGVATDTTGGAIAPEAETGPVPGGRLVHRVEAETTGGFCLPEAQLAVAGQTIARSVYDTLTKPDENGDMIPWLAESVEPNETFDVWTVKLRDGVTFHDGSPLTADVVKNNLDAFRGAYEGREPLLFVFIFENIESVEVVDDLTFTITTKSPWPSLPAHLGGDGRVGIMAQAQLDSDKCFEDMIGTGPFELSQRIENDHTTVVRNDDWWYADLSGLDVPYLDEIEFRPILSEPDAIRALRGGEIDSGAWSEGRNVADLRDLAQGDDYQLVETDAFTDVAYVLLNERQPPFDSNTAREALAYAVDRQLLVDIASDGVPRPASGPFGPGNVGFLEDAGYPAPDLEMAKELVAAYEAEAGEPLSFTLGSTADPDTITQAQAYQQFWQDAGAEVHLEQIADQSQLINAAIGGDFQALLWRNHPGGDPDTQYVWWCDGCPLNFGGIADPELQALLDEGRSETDAAARAAIYEDLNRRFSEQVHNLWGWWTQWAIGSRSDVFGFVPDELYTGAAGFPGLADGHETWAVYRTDQG